tara:strand:- start:158 stop:421 length:264 start_codon:yes stop_codon:yes gene_type:complete
VKKLTTYKDLYSLVEKYKNQLISDHYTIYEDLIEENSLGINEKILDPLSRSFIPLKLYLNTRCLYILADELTSYNQKVSPLLEALQD